RGTWNAYPRRKEDMSLHDQAQRLSKELFETKDPFMRGATTRFPIVICPTARRQTAPPRLSGPLSNHGAAAPLQHLNQRALWRDQLGNGIYRREGSSWASWTYTFGS